MLLLLILLSLPLLLPLLLSLTLDDSSFLSFFLPTITLSPSPLSSVHPPPALLGKACLSIESGVIAINCEELVFGFGDDQFEKMGGGVEELEGYW